MYADYYTLVSLSAGDNVSFNEYMNSFERAFELPLDELELHLYAMNARVTKANDEYEAAIQK